MSEFSKESLQALSKLCRIELTEEEQIALVSDLKRVLDYVEQLQEVDVSRITPYSHADEQGLDALRDDVIDEPLARETFLKNAPDQVGGMIRVPPVMKRDH